MHKKILILLTGSIALSISAVPVLASDSPTDDGQYIWQDENGDYWYRNGSEDELVDGKATRVGFEVKDGKKVRVAKATGKVID